MDKFIAQQVNSSPTTNSESAGLTTVTTTAKTVEDNAVDSVSEKPHQSVKASMRDEIKELTEQLAGLRSELEKFRSN